MRDEHEQQVTFGWSAVRRVARAPRASGADAQATPRQPPAPVPAAQPEPGVPVAASPASLPPENELWDVHAAARFLKRSVSWIYHRVEDGTLPVKRLAGWGVRFIPSELRAWVETGGAVRRGR